MEGQTDGRTDGGECITSHANAVGNQDSHTVYIILKHTHINVEGGPKNEKIGSQGIEGRGKIKRISVNYCSHSLEYLFPWSLRK